MVNISTIVVGLYNEDLIATGIAICLVKWFNTRKIIINAKGITPKELNRGLINMKVTSENFKKITKKILPKPILSLLKKIFNTSADYHKSYSQEGEDMIVNSRLLGEKKGFYVDIGAFDPKKYSNTYFFYQKGWRGINIDPRPGSMQSFRKVRPRDINLETAISNKKEVLTYYNFNQPALNGFSEQISEERNGSGWYRIISKTKIVTSTLCEILDTYLPSNTPIDFMSIDTEGWDYKVLQSNNWDKYKPGIILIEELGNSYEKLLESPIFSFLQEKGYEIVAKTYNTLIFKLKK